MTKSQADEIKNRLKQLGINASIGETGNGYVIAAGIEVINKYENAKNFADNLENKIKVS